MRHKLQPLALLLLLLVVPPAAGAATWLTRVDQAVARAAEDDRYILVDLYADWCGWCKVLEERVFSTPKFQEFARDFVLLRVDVEDGGEGSELQARYGAGSLPTTLIIDARMVRIGEIPGFAPTAEFIRMLEAELEAYRQLVRYYEQMRRSNDLDALRVLAEELHNRGDGQRAVVLYERVRRQLPGGSGAAWLHYLIADAHRLGGQFEEAQRALREARSISGRSDRDLVERLDLLTFYIAQDRGDCAQAVASLERFLEEHPRSSHRRQVERTLEALRNRTGTVCA